MIKRVGHKHIKSTGEKVELYAVFCQCEIKGCLREWIFRATKKDQLPVKCANKQCPNPYYWNGKPVDKK
jgi:hypothetical protein